MSTPFLVKDINLGAFSSYPGSLTVLGNTLFFIVDDNVNGYKLWKSDGTVAGTVAVADIRSRPNLTAVGNTLFFAARDGLTVRNCGKATARRLVRFWSKISAPVPLGPSPAI
ncbi:hypothetical protein [Microcystis aeruginosa]|uniref:Hyalin n=1 Tax=Microcystis aeruginosa NIES-298 TaxID=449468 RepID=A0A9P2YFH7_MICAE|nr:hypothetical protein [Microcystis aeruginosa]GBD51211.1 hypothetical protein BGM30_03040 [Microcystis aeruginosa NIES-298]